VSALVDNHGYGLAPLRLAPGNEGDRGVGPAGLKGLNRLARAVGLDGTGAVLNLEAGFESNAPR
jgi:hypothetical protein